MDYTSLFKGAEGKKSRVGIIGATRGYGYTLLAQIPKVELMELRLISSRHTDECMEVLTGLGYKEENIVVCTDKDQVKNAPKDAVLIVTDYRLVPECDITALVECTGNTAVSSEVSVEALKKGINVYMVSKETDSVCGTMLNQIAAENNAVYSLVNGDQPRNLLDLYSWGRVLGLEIVAAGKASEYDFVWDPDTNEFTYMEGTEKPHENIPGMKEFWHYKDRETLDERRKLVEKYMAVISADLCEMNLVSNVTGLVPSAPRLNYPVAKISELADIFIPEEDGGILKKTGVVDVFCNLRSPDEASFAGGEFIIIKCENETVWELLISKGHVVSRNGKYACIYLPYHYMGLETPISILLGDLVGIGTHPECRQVSVMAGVAQEDLPKGTVLKVHGHHHSIDGLVPELWEKKDAEEVAPFYLLNGTTLLKDVKKGQPITKDVVDLTGSRPNELYEQGLKL
ncbi:homoserine dehydrogenase [Lachnoclostridium edouardi]|uniref:homoserine dehydrogenase n=1 Tax=Lachnoclostridium edouardi TaxID=1926283 RepID=UPI000C7DD7A4|nr:homoserine dehydrogenase [Lachnoclostridium edouardi]